MLELHLHGSPPIIDDIPSVFHLSQVGSGMPSSLATTDIIERVVGRLSSVLMGHQCVNLLLCLALAFKELSQYCSDMF